MKTHAWKTNRRPCLSKSGSSSGRLKSIFFLYLVIVDLAVEAGGKLVAEVLQILSLVTANGFELKISTDKNLHPVH